MDNFGSLLLGIAATLLGSKYFWDWFERNWTRNRPTIVESTNAKKILDELQQSSTKAALEASESVREEIERIRADRVKERAEYEAKIEELNRKVDEIRDNSVIQIAALGERITALEAEKVALQAREQELTFDVIKRDIKIAELELRISSIEGSSEISPILGLDTLKK